MRCDRRRECGTIQKSAEMRRFIDAHGWQYTNPALRLELERRFPDAKRPSRSALHRYLNGIGRCGRLFSAESEPGLAAFLRERHPYMTLEKLCEAMREAFPSTKLPSRSSVQRFTASVRRRELLAPSASIGATARMEEIERTLRAIRDPISLLEEWRVLYEAAHEVERRGGDRKSANRLLKEQSFPKHAALRLGIPVRTIQHWLSRRCQS